MIWKWLSLLISHTNSFASVHIFFFTWIKLQESQRIAEQKAKDEKVAAERAAKERAEAKKAEQAKLEAERIEKEKSNEEKVATAKAWVAQDSARTATEERIEQPVHVFLRQPWACVAYFDEQLIAVLHSPRAKI